MESKTDLVKIGQEGFAILDEYCTRKGMQSASPHNFLYQYQPQKPNTVYQAIPVSRTERIVIQNHDPAKPDLVKIGLEGFALLDEYFGKKSGPAPPVAPRKPPVLSRRPIAQVKSAYATEEKVMNAYEAAKLHGGVLIISRSNHKMQKYGY